MKENDDSEEKQITTFIGFLFFIDGFQLYFLDELGRICLIRVTKKKIKGLKVKESYEISNLVYISQDKDTLYYIYNVKKNTNFINKKSNTINIKFAIIKLISLDEREIQNKSINILFLSSTISVKIVNNIQFVCTEKEDNFSYYIEDIKLYINNKSSQIFKLFIYKTEINTINISYKDINKYYNKSYELIFLSKEQKYLPNEVIVSGKKIINFDNFSCTHRRRFNIINVRIDRSIYKFNDGDPSYETIYLINEKNNIIKYGVFNYILIIKSSLNKDFKINDDYRDYLQEFWKNYNENTYYGIFYKKQISILNQKFKKSELDKFRAIKDIQLPIYSKDSLNNNDTFEFFRNYCFFVFIEILSIRKIPIDIDKFFSLLKQINKYCCFDKIRILLFFVYLVDKYEQLPKLIDIKELKKEDINNPYYQAIKLQKEIIKNLTEKSLLFYPLIQFNSFFVEYLPNNYFEYYFKKIKSYFKGDSIIYAYSISMESINEMKKHLLSLEDDFLFIFESKNQFNYFGFYSPLFQMVIINQYQLYRETSSLTDENEKKAVAFSINMILMHERMSHGKEALINYGINSPQIYFNKYFQIDENSYRNKNDEFIGEAGRLLESFIESPFLIRIMKTISKFQNFLDYKYFVYDFSEIRKHAISLVGNKSYNQLKATTNQYFIMISKTVLCLSFIRYLLGFLFNFNKKFIGIKLECFYLFFNIILIMILLIVLAKKYEQKYKDMGLFDIIGKKINNDENYNNENDEEEKLIFYPDDYPKEPNTFFGKVFSIFNFKEKKIQKKMLKYIYKENLY